MTKACCILQIFLRLLLLGEMSKSYHFVTKKKKIKFVKDKINDTISSVMFYHVFSTIKHFFEHQLKTKKEKKVSIFEKKNLFFLVSTSGSISW